MKIALITYYLRMNDYPTKYSLAALRLGEYLNSSGIDVEVSSGSFSGFRFC